MNNDSRQKFKISWEQKVLLQWNKTHHFLKGLQLPESVLDLRVRRSEAATGYV